MAEFVDALISRQKIVIFSKTYCPHCKQAQQIIEEYPINPESLEIVQIDLRKDCQEIQTYLEFLTGARSVPRVFIGSESLGGCDDTIEAEKNGRLAELLQKFGFI
ncbi:unnamed protein product [Caenorhabditis angaria]|uniref:Glutaredoxin-1 n=1 Tax=Caenorhabditis angaria TaxID=860376 RepID=A0A9P1N0V4_9PELO|nr:unnamed protein product [Caenorhabditis angaria]